MTRDTFGIDGGSYPVKESYETVRVPAAPSGLSAMVGFSSQGLTPLAMNCHPFGIKLVGNIILSVGSIPSVRNILSVRSDLSVGNMFTVGNALFVDNLDDSSRYDGCSSRTGV
jgi:hypothetical protein